MMTAYDPDLAAARVDYDAAVAAYDARVAEHQSIAQAARQVGSLANRVELLNVGDVTRELRTAATGLMDALIAQADRVRDAERTMLDRRARLRELMSV